MSHIASIFAQEILDSRGNPTLRVKVVTTSGAIGVAAVPSGASTGSHEAWELRDGGKRYGGKGVLKAAKNVVGLIQDALLGHSIFDQQGIDAIMIALDNTKNKKKLGANAMLGVSLACVHAAALEKNLPLYKYLRECFGLEYKDWRMPTPTMNIINGGAHADSGLDVQEFMIIPLHKKFAERVRMGAEVFHALKNLLSKKGFSISVGDEGGFAPRLGSTDNALAIIADAIASAGLTLGKNVTLGMDVAASEFYENGVYHFEGKHLFSAQMIAKIATWMKKYPLLSVEDPLAEDDWESWVSATRALENKGPKGYASIVGDDFFVTNKERLQKGIAIGAANAILIKVNQIGTLSETIETIQLAQKNGYKISVSHRSGETSDTTIADLAVAVNADYIKTGSLSRSERVEKYNRLMEIEEELYGKT